MELSRGERIAQTIAAVFGLIVATLGSVYVGAGSGAEIGVATFVLSWTAVALFVLLVRFVTHRLLRESGSPSEPAPQSITPVQSKRARRRRER